MTKKLVKNGKKIIISLFILIIILNTFGCTKIKNVANNVASRSIENKNNNLKEKFSLEIDKNDEEVFFGTYYQNDDKEKESIKWLILDRDVVNKKALLVTKYLIDYHEFGMNNGSELTWENSDIKKYVEKDFFENAFDEEEVKYIVANKKEKIFLLSTDEVEKYKLSICNPTPYASDKEKNNVYSGIYRWWLRTNGAGKNMLSFVNEAGKINYVGDTQDATNMYIRPALWVNYKEPINEIEKEKEIKNNLGSGIEIGNVNDIVKVGKYNTDFEDKKSNIEWIIINKNEDEGKALILSRYGIEFKKYNDFELKHDENGNVIEPSASDGVTWENSSIRTWLNNDFYNNSFEENEKQNIIISDLKTEDNIEYGINGGNDTKDKIFILSENELNQYVSNKNILKCMPSRLSREKIENSKKYKKDGPSGWWTRTPGGRNYMNISINTVGETSVSAQYNEELVRPAMWIYYKNKKEEDLKLNAKVLKIREEGSIVGFGKYQSNRYDENTVDYIRWRVLYKDIFTNKALLITDEIIDSIPFNETSESITWDKSYIRAWLNQPFFHTAFSDIDREKIVNTHLDNINRGSMGKGGKDTDDNVFLLSCDDLLLYLKDGDISADATNFAIQRGITSKEVDKFKKIYRGTYMLRNMDETNHYPYCVYPEEYFDCKQDRYTTYETGVRPAVWVYYEDTEKNLSYIYDKYNFNNMFIQLFENDKEEWDDLPLTKKFISDNKQKLCDKYKIYCDENDGYLDYNIDEKSKILTIDVYGPSKGIDGDISISMNQTYMFDYTIDDNGFINSITLQENAIKGKGRVPGVDYATNGPGAIIDEEKKEAERIEEERIKAIEQFKLPAVEKDDYMPDINGAQELSIGDEMTFGKYIRKDVKENIKWTIYEKNENDGIILLVSNQIIASGPYDTSELNFPDWRYSTLRTWLNNDFYNEAFDEAEKLKIVDTNVETDDKSKGDTIKTIDKIFILSEKEVNKYFPSKESKRCWATPYSHAKGRNSSYWWIRNSSLISRGKYVSDTGVIISDKLNDPENIGIRPAMWVKYK